MTSAYVRWIMAVVLGLGALLCLAIGLSGDKHAHLLSYGVLMGIPAWVLWPDAHTLHNLMAYIHAIDAENKGEWTPD